MFLLGKGGSQGKGGSEADVLQKGGLGEKGGLTIIKGGLKTLDEAMLL